MFFFKCYLSSLSLLQTTTVELKKLIVNEKNKFVIIIEILAVTQFAINLSATIPPYFKRVSTIFPKGKRNSRM